jgi:AraC-like DNA-binding protein
VKYRDTTDPATYRQLIPVMTDQTHPIEIERAAQIHFRIVGLYHSIVGPEWSSRGHEESDYFHYIHFVCGGRASITHKGRTLKLRPGRAYWLTGNTPVIRNNAVRYETYVLKFLCESDAGTDLLLDWPERKPLCLGAWDRSRWEPCWTRAPVPGAACLALQGQLRLWMAEAFPNLDKMIAHHHRTFARFANAFEMLEERLGADLRIADLAGAHGTSLHAFSMAFERHIGMSPKAYLNRRLNQEACRLLLNTDCRIKEVGRKLAFADEFYFSRFFSKMNNKSPGKFRRDFVTSHAK